MSDFAHDVPSPVDPARILLVEDHGDSLRVMGRLLRLNGYAVKMAATAWEAAALAAAARDAGERFDLLISDLLLPDASGLDLIRQLRAGDAGLKGIALTGMTDEHAARASAEAGFARHLDKPVVFTNLLNVIREVLCPPGGAGDAADGAAGGMAWRPC